MNKFPEAKILPYFLVGPSILVIFIFLIYPFAQAVIMSFQRQAAFGAGLRYVGLENYRRLFTSARYLQSIGLTFLFAFIVIAAGLSISLFVARLTNSQIRGKSFYQVAFIWTYAMSPAIAGVIWALLFDPSIGLFTHSIFRVTGIRLNFFSNPIAGFMVVTIASIWIMMGYNVTFFIAGLQNIPDQLIEAAKIDGASTWQTFWKITFPMLSPTTAFLVFMNTVYSFFLVFGLIDTVTQGGPQRATEFLVYSIYLEGFSRLRPGMAGAQSVILFLIVATLATYQLYATTRKAIYSRR